MCYSHHYVFATHTQTHLNRTRIHPPAIEPANLWPSLTGFSPTIFIQDYQGAAALPMMALQYRVFLFFIYASGHAAMTFIHKLVLVNAVTLFFFSPCIFSFFFCVFMPVFILLYAGFDSARGYGFFGLDIFPVRCCLWVACFSRWRGTWWPRT